MPSKLSKVLNLRWQYLIKGSLVSNSGVLHVEKGTTIDNSRIYISKGSSLRIGKDCQISNVSIHISAGDAEIGEGTIINNDGGYKKILIDINHGTLKIGERNRLQCDIKLRFNAILTIGAYNNINHNSEIRADEQITIENFNQISYDCVIWDTNTHNIYSDEERRQLTVKHYPKYGYEHEKPKTAPIFIGSDCWIGRRASILKGTTINNSVIVGYGAITTNVEIPVGHTLVNEVNNKIFKRK
jgi:acetyltransferase-like isoleucine patch superfamily enzyme